MEKKSLKVYTGFVVKDADGGILEGKGQLPEALKPHELMERGFILEATSAEGKVEKYPLPAAPIISQARQVHVFSRQYAHELSTCTSVLFSQVDLLESDIHSRLQSRPDKERDELLSGLQQLGRESMGTFSEFKKRARNPTIHTVGESRRIVQDSINFWAENARMLALVGEKLEKINLEVDPSSSDRINQIKQVHSRAVKLTENQRRLLSGEPAIEEKSVFKVGALVSEAVESMKTATRFDSITLNAPDGNLEVLADQQKLFGALINLIKNGIESCKARQQKDRDMGNPSVDVTVDGDEDTVKIQVKDNGLGIPPERLDEIFSGESTKESGHGIGLLLAKKTIESYGGTLTAESDGENKGATFTITLPKQKSH